MESGLFSPLASNAIGDPYVDRFRDTGHGTAKGVRQFGISHGLPGNFRRLYEGEPYIDQYKTEVIQQVSSKKKMITSNGFRYSSPPKKAFPGDYNGTFTKPYPHLPEGNASRGRRDPVKVNSPRKIYTSPSKKSTHGLTPHLCFTDIPYIPSDYEGDRKKRQAMEKAEKAKVVGPAFIVRKSQHPIEESQLKPDTTPLPVSPIGSRPQSAKVGVFRPSSPTHQRTFGSINYVPDPYDEKKVRAAINPSRVLPETTLDGSKVVVSRGRTVWRPNSPSKEMFTKSIAYFRK